MQFDRTDIIIKSVGYMENYDKIIKKYSVLQKYIRLLDRNDIGKTIIKIDSNAIVQNLYVDASYMDAEYILANVRMNEPGLDFRHMNREYIIIGKTGRHVISNNMIWGWVVVYDRDNE